ncbi:DegT/DnrJ/EryC1/StrS family aminotransferase [Paenibacillus sp. HW567]|uniref:DegT/DnrJ/EryC1/StrS family aminotransferase n=1 Tax=Paenibacillus sp. HW567 TaxID=1034769 RepID=UPI000367F705|nr:DegT/DnrJ/EryC1/StrS family aminotransferase [Paenibacillus sp. HW567]
MNRIQLFKPVYRVEECLDGIRECLQKGWTGLGYKTIEFEEQWKQYTGLPHAHYVNSATSGLHLAIKILKEKNGWNDGDEVISTPLTFISTNHSILYEHLNVVFADVDQYLCLDPGDVEKKITDRTRAVVFVGLGGNTGQYKRIVELCSKYGLSLILDAAHMAGTRLDGAIPGHEADAVVYSFQAVKNLPTADSGMICLRDPELDFLCRKLSWLGIDKDTYSRSQGNYKWMYEIKDVGYKYHGNSIMAAIGLVQLKYLDEDNAYRRKIAGWYDACFAQAGDKVKPVPVADGCLSSRHLYVIEVEHREEMLEHLNRVGIYPGVHYRDNTEYDIFAASANTCPNSGRLSHSIISLPLHLEMTQQDVETVASEIMNFS